ncbi:hypothetical protein Tco_1103655 [Tanacetum coccineum]
MEEEGDGYIKEVIRVEYEWKPPHCVDCQSFGHETNLCPKRVREELPKNSAKDTKATAMEENDDGFIEVKSRKKKKGADSRSFGRLRLNKPNSKVIWQQKKGGDTKGRSHLLVFLQMIVVREWLFRNRSNTSNTVRCVELEEMISDSENNQILLPKSNGCDIGLHLYPLELVDIVKSRVEYSGSGVGQRSAS